MAVGGNQVRSDIARGGPVSGRIRIFRLIGSFAFLFISANTFVCMLRDTYSDFAALTPYFICAPLSIWSLVVCRKDFAQTLRSSLFRSISHLLVQGALGLVILGLLFYTFGHRFHLRISLGGEGEFELSEASRSVVDALSKSDQVVEMYLLEGEPSATEYQRDMDRSTTARIRELLEAYVAEAGFHPPGKLSLMSVSMLEEPQQLALLGKRTGLTFTRDYSGSMVLLQGDRVKVIPKRDFFGVGSVASDGRAIPAFVGERVVTASLRALLTGQQKVAYYLIGHGEPFEKNTESFRGLFRSLNLDLRSIDLSAEVEIPREAGLMVICGPREELKKEELGRIADYARAGGRLLILLDPVASAHAILARRDSGLQEILQFYGVTVHQDLMTRMFRPDVLGHSVAVDQLPSFPNQDNPSPLLANIRLERTPVVFSLPCAFSLRKPDDADYVAEALLLAKEQEKSTVWADRPENFKASSEGPGEAGIKAPVPLGVWVRSEKPHESGTRIVALASSRLAQDPDLVQHLGNQIFLRAAILWLLGEDQLAAEAMPQDHKVPMARLGSEDNATLFGIFVLGLPLMVAFGGVLIWVARRN